MSQYLFGLNAVAEALGQGRKVVALYVEAQRNPRLEEIVAQATERHVAVKQCERRQLDKMVGDVRHQGVVAQVKAQDFVSLAQLLAQSSQSERFFLILDGITDPHNFGALIRSAAAAGCQGVIFAKDRSCPVTGIVEKTAAGTLGYVQLCQVTNLGRAIEKLKKAGVWVYGLAGEEGQSLFEAPLSAPIALVAGSEGRGIRPLIRKLCDGLIAIPMPGRVESLNVSVATGIALFEVVRNHLKIKK
ncbi:23S rRNA (guanosine(2251)-2'-O)-methyltransferase RlmB [Desulfuromonas acetoxidans]|uniref:23S rRNA (guanosine(2251)-2'-O)-methyltransferase RlmB n=1 Tax=Desulfuromonas acetoxidans TaxID=891 RepID=UPI00292F6006|nr:23S rRNA (guanosine(2251)-2'-O)-methyltransferase RlmB [Desulfuromonas acetoxidans]